MQNTRLETCHESSYHIRSANVIEIPHSHASSLRRDASKCPPWNVHGYSSQVSGTNEKDDAGYLNNEYVSAELARPCDWSSSSVIHHYQF